MLPADFHIRPFDKAEYDTLIGKWYEGMTAKETTHAFHPALIENSLLEPDMIVVFEDFIFQSHAYEISYPTLRGEKLRGWDDLVVKDLRRMPPVHRKMGYTNVLEQVLKPDTPLPHLELKYSRHRSYSRAVALRYRIEPGSSLCYQVIIHSELRNIFRLVDFPNDNLQIRAIAPHVPIVHSGGTSL
ncbi:MAG: hypothetical protein ABIA93_06145 [Candidatus Woesearchaeota archaeon]